MIVEFSTGGANVLEEETLACGCVVSERYETWGMSGLLVHGRVGRFKVKYTTFCETHREKTTDAD